MIQKISINDFLQFSENNIVIDVRSPIEFNYAHIPNAINIPLFNDEERKIVGTVYKQQSREAAIKVGLDFFGPKMKLIVEEIERKIKELKNEGINNEHKTLPDSPLSTFQLPIYIHCARGGMRSAAVAWLLDLYGFKIVTLTGGYKAYRNWVLQQFEKNYSFKILSGNTGSGKTKVLQQMCKKHTVIDLEGLANHKGSAFGNIGMPPQPTQEMFENLLAKELLEKEKQPPIWLEDESQRIGINRIPKNIWDQMRSAEVYFLQVEFEKRLENTLEEYGKLPKQELKESILKITKRLGGLETKNAITFLDDGDIKSCFTILLKYYDKQYKKGMEKRDNLNSKSKIVTKEYLIY